uniref:Phospholipid carrier-dependent glycosyltransferase n=1 Tax=Schlesneria paludicola TaxID=360056 RepID=A0A7C4LMM4_9PLAN
MQDVGHRWAGVGAVMLAALVIRLGVAAWVDRTVAATPGRICLIPGDAEGYWELGRRLARGEEYALYEPPRRVLRMPGLPLLLAASQRIWGESVWPARCLLATIGALACGLVYWLGGELANRSVGWWAAAATACSPALAVFSPLLLTETPFATAMLASLIAWAKLWTPAERCRPGTALAAGGLSAVATYLRPTWLPIAPLAAVWLIARAPRHRGAWCEGLLAVGILGAALFPWAWRNHGVTGHWVATTLWVGPSLYDGLRPGANGDSDMRFFDEDRLLDRMSEYEMDQEYRRRAWAFVAAEPFTAVRLAGRKALRYWSVIPNADQFRHPWIIAGLAATTLSLYFGAVWGLIGQRKNVRLCVMTTFPVLFFAAVHMVFVGSIRYRLPAEYPLWILAAAGFHDVWQRWRTWTAGRTLGDPELSPRTGG